MDFKVALILFLVFFASTIAITATVFNLPALNAPRPTKTLVYIVRTGYIQPTGGDPVDNDVAPN